MKRTLRRPKVLGRLMNKTLLRQKKSILSPLGLTFKEKGMKCLLYFGVYLHERRYLRSIE